MGGFEVVWCFWVCDGGGRGEILLGLDCIIYFWDRMGSDVLFGWRNADGRSDVVDSLERAFGQIDDEGILRGLRVVVYALSRFVLIAKLSRNRWHNERNL